MNKLLAALVFFSSTVVLAFPENVRRGYSNCASCHVSPTGGGALNAYGRMSSAEILSALSVPKEEVYFTAPTPSWFSYGGDTRYLNFSGETCDEKYSKKFLMQSDIELALSPIPGLTVGGSVGFYGVELPVQKKYYEEQRRSYVMLNLNENFTLRAGRFFPAYGIHVADHTTITRQMLGFGQGQETYNVEASARGQYGELFLTGVGGTSGRVELNGKKGYKWDGDGPEDGLVARGAVYLGDSYQVGASLLRLVSKTSVRTSYGVYGLLGFTHNFYGLFEIDRLHDGFGVNSHLWLAKLGVEPFQGIHLTVAYEGMEKFSKDWRFGLTLYPRPHWELISEFIRRMPIEGPKADEWVFVWHHYL